jgi:hypothetical protein
MGRHALIAGFKASFFAPLVAAPVWLLYLVVFRDNLPSSTAIPGTIVVVAFFSFIFGLIVCTTVAPVTLLLLHKLKALNVFTGCIAGGLLGTAFVCVFAVNEPFSDQHAHLAAQFGIVGAVCGLVATKQFLNKTLVMSCHD